MAVESRASKRKSTAKTTQKSKKPKRVVEETVKVSKKKSEKSAPTENTTAESIDVPAPTKKSSRKRAADFFEGEDTAVAPTTTSKTKKVKKVEAKEESEEKTEALVKKASKAKKSAAAAEPEESLETKVSKSTGDKKRKKKGKVSEVVEEVPETAEVEDEEDELDDQTAALLKGFESSEDEDEVVDDEIVGIENIPSAPTNKALQKKLKAAAENDEQRGVVYVGRIPHGFYEHQMRAYFSQFGDITRLRLSRNKKTGASKHYAFVEFKSSEVARIVADTMDKYLMFNHILQVRTIPPERVHESLFAGANSRFKAVPRNKLAGKHLRQPLHREGWEKRIIKENKRRAAVSEKLKEIGYEFESPAVKGVDVLAVKAIEAPTEQLVLTAEADNSADEDVVSKEVTTTVESKPGRTTVVETVVKKRKTVDRKKSDASLQEAVSEKKSSYKKGSKAKGKKSKVVA